MGESEATRTPRTTALLVAASREKKAMDAYKARENLMKIGVDLSKADWVWRGVERSALLWSALPDAWRVCLQTRATGYFEVAGSQFSQIVLFSDGTWFALAPPQPATVALRGVGGAGLVPARTAAAPLQAVRRSGSLGACSRLAVETRAAAGG